MISTKGISLSSVGAGAKSQRLYFTPFMSDPRFARLRTDPRFRRPKKHQSKVVIDERFQQIFEDGKTKGKKGALFKCSIQTSILVDTQ